MATMEEYQARILIAETIGKLRITGWRDGDLTISDPQEESIVLMKTRDNVKLLQGFLVAFERKLDQLEKKDAKI